MDVLREDGKREGGHVSSETFNLEGQMLLKCLNSIVHFT